MRSAASCFASASSWMAGLSRGKTVRLLQGERDDLRLDLERRPVRQDRLAAAHLRQSEIATFVIEFLEAVETIAAVA